MAVAGLPNASSNLNGSLHLGPCRSSPCRCFLPGKISLYKCHGGNCFPKSFVTDLTWKAWCVFFSGGTPVIGNDCGKACRGECPKARMKRFRLERPSRLDHLQGRWWFLKFLILQSQKNRQTSDFYSPRGWNTLQPCYLHALWKQLMFVQSCSQPAICFALVDNRMLCFGWNGLFLCSGHTTFTLLFLNLSSSHLFT